MYTLLSAKLSEKAALDTELQSVKDELRREVEEKETLHACNEGLRARQREMSDQLEAVEAELRRSQEEDAVLATLAAKLREKASLKVQLEAARDELARERADSLEQLTGVEAKLRAALEEIENLRREVSTMRTELDRKEGERSEVEVELRRERGERATLVERLSSMEDELKASEEKRAVLYSELKTVQKEKELLQQSILQVRICLHPCCIFRLYFLILKKKFKHILICFNTGFTASRL